jgi:hypothetical protein
VALASTTLAGCAWLGLERPDLPDLPEVHLPSFGSDDAPAKPAPEGTVEVVTGAPELEFHGRAAQFYERLTGRRFNSVTTFRDPTLREYFESEESFSEYFADLAQELADAHFERNEPVTAKVDEFVVEAPGRARVRVRIGGENGLPLRFWSTSLVREDRWERREGRWWIVPSAL